MQDSIVVSVTLTGLGNLFSFNDYKNPKICGFISSTAGKITFECLVTQLPFLTVLNWLG